MTAQLMTNTAILEVFVHEDESTIVRGGRGLPEPCAQARPQRLLMLYEPEQLTRRAGQGIRQGFDDAVHSIPFLS